MFLQQILPFLAISLVTTTPTPTPLNFNGIISAIEKEAEIFLTERSSFSQDTLLTQTKDGYVRANNGGGHFVFKRKADKSDDGKGLVVLTRDEDHLPKTEDKRTFVVLRQSFDSPKNYWVLYAYVRDATKDTPGAVDIDGSKKLIEFDTWDHRGHHEHNSHHDLNDGLDLTKEFFGDDDDSVEEDYSRSDDDSSKSATIPKFQSASTYDLFTDLDDDDISSKENVLEQLLPTLQGLPKMPELPVIENVKENEVMVEEEDIGKKIAGAWQST